MRQILDILDPYRWLVGGVLIASLASGLLFYRASLIREGQERERQAQAVVESDRLREAKREITRLVGVTNNLNEAYRVQIAAIDDLERRAKSAGMRVTKAERDAAIARGSAEAVSRYAVTAGDVYQACRDEYRSLGYEAARGSATAHTLKQWADEVDRPSVPTPPTPPSQP